MEVAKDEKNGQCAAKSDARKMVKKKKKNKELHAPGDDEFPGLLSLSSIQSAETRTEDKRGNVSEWLMWRENQSLKTDQPGDDAADAQTRERINSDEQTLIFFAIHRWLSQSRLRGLHNCSSPQRK